VGSQIPYQQFQFLPANGGATIFNGPEDILTVQQGLFQVRRPIEATPERAREDVVGVLRVVQRRLAVETFVQCGVKVIVHLPAPGATPDSKTFVAERLLRQGADAVQELGPKFFAGGVKYRSIDENREEVLQIEPFVRDNTFLFVDYDVQIAEQFTDVDAVSDWIDEAFEFVKGPGTRILRM
jgi:hypothetical protein